MAKKKRYKKVSETKVNETDEHELIRTVYQLKESGKIKERKLPPIKVKLKP